MMPDKPPLFMENEDWFYYDPDMTDNRGYKLTDKAPKEAVESYNEFYAMLESDLGQVVDE